jgi:hypothetical protein
VHIRFYDRRSDAKPTTVRFPASPPRAPVGATGQCEKTI